MMLLGMKTYVALLWGSSVLFESMSAPVPESSSMNSTAEPNKTTEQQISAHAAHSETETQPATWHPTDHHRPAEVSVAATAETSVSPTVETVEAIIANRSDSAAALVVMDTAAATMSSSGPWLLHTSAAATKAVGGSRPPDGRADSETAKPTAGQLHQGSPAASADTTAPATPSATTSTATLATAAVSSPQPSSTTKPEVTSWLFSTTSSAGSTQTPLFTRALGSPSASTAPAVTVTRTSEAALVFEPTTEPSTEVSSKPVSETTAHVTTSEFPKPAGLSSTTEPAATSTDSAITTTAFSTAFSTSPAGIWIPRVTKRLPIPTAKSTPATAKVSNSPADTEVPPCSNRGLVKHCLIAITSLAGLATVFIVSTIILCTKLSTRKYKVRKPQQATEMMCISALLPERDYNYRRQRNPVTNGVLVMHAGGDSDEDGGDNLTLSSFLPENDRLV